MAFNLASRIGEDTLGKLERAARRRYAEALLLAADEPLGAVYLYGYVIEVRLKAAYYRVIGLAPASATRPHFQAACTRIRQLLNLPHAVPVGRHLVGWARLLEDARRTVPGAAPLAVPLLAELHMHAQTAHACWTETLRYRPNRPYDEELQAMADAARWLKRQYTRLWS